MTPEELLAKVAQLDLEATKEWVSLWKVIIPSIITFATVYLAYRFAINQARTKRNADLTEKQLLKFYSPIWGCIKRIHAQGELRAEISQASDVAWQNVCERSPKPFLKHEEEFVPYKKLIKYDNEQLTSEVIPLYDKALEIFTSEFWLSEESTRQFYEEFYRFVEIWHRYLDRSLPMDAFRELEHGGDKLKPFYEDIEENMINLKKKLKCL